MDIQTYQSLGLDVPWEDLHPRNYQVNGRAISDIDAGTHLWSIGSYVRENGR